ncbi:hypothetical protein UK15_07760 [Streptomyces variegatus]|uniref:Uncharacterized protein n=1 Tax=Streptomyces variegatus TaxID=284040 RepID=A0A0M2GX63_9ACTN|nr:MULTISPECIES: hypothetical protein [Streptomyces]KJK40238.1 hypothetical protein UK15_07760 [Streptomyces variegatus]
MTTYQGPATAIAGGTEYPVTADLAIATDGFLKEWSGTIIAEDEGAAWAIFNEDDTTALRIGEERSGVFIAGTFNADSAELRIQGSGPAPFGP